MDVDSYVYNSNQYLNSYRGSMDFCLIWTLHLSLLLVFYGIGDSYSRELDIIFIDDSSSGLEMVKNQLFQDCHRLPKLKL